MQPASDFSAAGAGCRRERSVASIGDFGVNRGRTHRGCFSAGEEMQGVSVKGLETASGICLGWICFDWTSVGCDAIRRIGLVVMGSWEQD